MTITTNNIGPTARMQMGTRILGRAHGVPLGSAKQSYDDFVKSQQRYATAQDEVKRRRINRDEAVAELFAAKAHMDSTIMRVAGELAADGGSRISPFDIFGAKAPSEIVSMRTADAVDAVAALVARVLGKKGLRAETVRSAKAALSAAGVVREQLARSDAAKAAQRGAIGRRDDLEAGWNSSFLAFKHAVHVAEYQGAPGLFAQLFEEPATPRRHPSKRAAKPPAPKTGTANDNASTAGGSTGNSSTTEAASGSSPPGSSSTTAGSTGSPPGTSPPGNSTAGGGAATGPTAADTAKAAA